MSNALTATEKWAPVQSGEVRMEDPTEGFGMSQNMLAVSMGVPPRRINEAASMKLCLA